MTLWAVVGALIVLWFLALLSGFAGSLAHLLLLAAVVVMLVEYVQDTGRS